MKYNVSMKPSLTAIYVCFYVKNNQTEPNRTGPNLKERRDIPIFQKPLENTFLNSENPRSLHLYK